jgi:AhpD family alkylhydroperoxidase
MPNPKLARVPRDAMTPRSRADYDAALALRDDATFNAVAANAPELYDWYKDEFYGRVFYGGRVDARTKELLRYRLSMTHGCAYCNKGNSKAASKAGVTEEQLSHVMNEAHACFDARDRAVLALAAEMAMTNIAGELSAPLYAALREHFDDAQVFELGVVAGILTGMAKFLFVYDLVEREAHCA